ncbi:MAG: hypothetical protein ABI216_22180 [Devosia sp.]
MANTDIAKQQLNMAQQQLAWEKNRAEVQDPMIQKIVDQQIAVGDDNAQRATDQWNTYQTLFKPVESKMVDDAMNYDSPERKAQMAAEAGADVTKSYSAAQDQNTRTMGALGINPNSGRFAGLTAQTSLAQAKDTAGAMNQARRNTELQGIALRTGAAQFGRNMPNTGIAADSTALNAGSSAVGNMANQNQMTNQNTAAAQAWFGGAANSNSQAGSLLNNLYGNQLQASQMGASQTGQAMQMVGTLAGAGMMAF